MVCGAVFPMPRQELIEPRSRMVGDAAQPLGEPGLRIDAAALGRLDQREHRRGALAASVGTGEQPGLAADRNRPVILPMSGKRSRPTIAGTHSMGVASDARI